jgi:hypothetical protein
LNFLAHSKIKVACQNIEIDDVQKFEAKPLTFSSGCDQRVIAVTSTFGSLRISTRYGINEKAGP